MAEQANVLQANENCAEDGLVILNLTLDDLNNSNLGLRNDVSLDINAAEKLEQDEDLTRLQKLLEGWNLVQLLPVLKDCGVTYRSLIYLSKEDIKEAVPDIGLRAEFRSKLFMWRKVEHNIDDETITVQSKVASWLETTNSDPSTSTIRSLSCNTCKLSKSLCDLLKESNKGRSILEYYKNHTLLDKIRRDALVSIILEDIQYNGLYLSPKDYPPILKEIENTFPAEKNFLDYYFFSRQKRKNPGGRLYNKYVNSTTKIRKIGNSWHAKPSAGDECPEVPDNQEFDEDILKSIKTSLQRDFTKWTEVKDRWEKTFVLRHRDLRNSDHASIVNFLKEWPLYSHTHSKDLIDIDFRLLFPGKEILLYSKWELFKKKIKTFYTTSINDKSCKQLFSSLSEKTETNAEDYILTILLNSVILPTSRFSVAKGNSKRKVTIKDAQESFTLRIPTINDFEHSLGELRAKHYNKEYPQASYGPWYFIQKYIFEIETEYDKPLPSVSSLVAYLNSH